MSIPENVDSEKAPQGEIGFELVQVSARRPTDASSLFSSKRQLEALTLAQAIVHFNLAGEIVDVNQQFLEIFGYCVDDVKGRHHSMFVPLEEADTEEYTEFWCKLGEGVHQTATFKRIGKNQREVWIQASYIPILADTGQPIGVVKYAIDVTQARLDSSEHEGQIAAIGRAQAVVEFRMDGTILSANPIFLEILGYELHELLGVHHSYLLLPEERCLPQYEKFWRELRRGKHQTSVFERRAKDGSLRFLQASYSPIFDLNGVPTKVIKYATDVTKQKTLELDLQRVSAEAVSGSRAKSQFLAMMSHEIRTPMNGIIAATDLLLESELSPPQQELANIVHSSGEALLSLLNDILDFSKLEAGKLEIEAVPTDVRALIGEVEKLFKIQKAESGLQLLVSWDESLPRHVLLSSMRLRQIIVNLCSNAYKFTSRGSVSVCCGYDESVQPARLRLSVRDTGIGMADTGFLFQEFSQLNAKTTREFGGTGLGLAICKRLAEAMGGGISVESELGVGSCFTVEVQASVCEAPESQKLELLGHLAPGRALVVDDNKTNRLIAERLLTNLGWTATCVDSGLAALNVLEDSSFDVILMDCQMPGMDGFETTAKIRAGTAKGAALPIVAMTAGVMIEERQACLDAGMNDFVPKPVRRPQLAQVLARLMVEQGEEVSMGVANSNTDAKAKAS